jgi:hypothetical protein
MAAGEGKAELGGEWKAEFRRTLMEWVVREGEPVDEGGSRYTGSHHPDWLGLGAHLNQPAYIRQARYPTAHQRSVIAEWTAGTPDDGCELQFGAMSWSDSSWTTWDSFAEDAERRTGVDVRVFCVCGRIAGVMWRWEGGYAELLRGITE